MVPRQPAHVPDDYNLYLHPHSHHPHHPHQPRHDDPDASHSQNGLNANPPPNQTLHVRPPLAPRLWSRLSNFSRKSFRSFSSSFEADDERSTSDEGDNDDDYYYYYYHRYHPYGSMTGYDGLDGDDGDPGRRSVAVAPKYRGEDTRPTSQKELAGWYAYAFAAETYVICGSFIPILLETLARENGVLASDRVTPCGTSDSKSKADGQCVVYVLGVEINTASFAMYTFSVSVLVQALLVVSISCAADHGNYRKKLLLGFGWTGGLAVMLYIFVTKELYLFGAFLAIVSNTSFGSSFVLLNSFLPLLVRYHPEVLASARAIRVPGFTVARDVESRPSGEEETTGDNDSAVGDMEQSTSALLPDQSIPKKKEEELTSIELNLSTQISARGIGIGYIAGLFLQCLGIGVLIAMGNSTWSLRVVLFMVGTWWTVFTIPAALWLRPRPGPSLPIGAASGFKGPWMWVGYVIYAWKSLYKTARLARRLLDIMLFLGAWFLLSDAIATTSSTAILFAKTSLHMKAWALGMISVISTMAGVVGAFSWAYISRRFGLRPHQTILVCIGLFELIPLYGLLGYLPFVKAWGVLGLQQPWEMYPLAAVYGLVLGGLSGYCRSVYGELIPPGSEAAFYALYAITDKGSSVFGPAIVGAIIDRSGEIRPAFWFLACIVGLPAPLIYFVNVDRGKREGAKLAEVIEGRRETEAAADINTDSGSDDRPILSAYDDDEEEVDLQQRRHQ